MYTAATPQMFVFVEAAKENGILNEPTELSFCGREGIF